MEVILTIAYAILFLLLIRKLPFFRLEGLHRNTIPIIFIIKILAGLLVYLVYTRYYPDRRTADIFKYFDDSKVMYDALFTSPGDFLSMITGTHNDSPHFAQYYNQMNNWYRVYESNIYNDSHTIIRLNAVLRIFSFGFYNVHTVFMCFFSLAGLTGIYRFLSARLSDRRYLLMISIFLLPSVLFWGSGVLKEGLLFLGLGMLLWHIWLILHKRAILLSSVMIAGSMVLLLYTKFYIIIIMIPLLVAYLWCHFTKGKRALLKYAVVLALFITAGLNMHYLFPHLNFLHLMVHKQHDFIALAQSVNSGSVLAVRPLEDNILSLITNLPQALYNSMFLPWFFQGGSVLTIFAGMENLLIILLLIITLLLSRFRIKDLSSFYLCVFFALGIFALTGLTTPVVGAIVRYKVPALPFLVTAMIMAIDKEKFNAVFILIKKRKTTEKK